MPVALVAPRLIVVAAAFLGVVAVAGSVVFGDAGLLLIDGHDLGVTLARRQVGVMDLA